MLGWEYPPHIAGGLGTACQGLTQGLARQGVELQFVLPHVCGDEVAPHMTMVDPQPVAAVAPHELAAATDLPEQSIERYSVPAFLMPYWGETEYTEFAAKARETIAHLLAEGQAPDIEALLRNVTYGNDIFDEVAMFAARVARSLPAFSEFDVIHAHDWMTFPAATILRQLTGKPLVVHVHSLEYDRSGSHKNRGIHEIEHLGISAADRVIAVSHYTKQIIAREHAVSDDKICVVHNGIYPKQIVSKYRAKHPDWPKYMVLFLGRVTFQKGPDYFVRAAAKVLSHLPAVRFVLAGSGDMLDDMKQLASQLGIREQIDFPGFLRGEAVEEMFSMADLYVMPSVSEPFGISALEAVNFDVPALISRQSGVSEVVGHSLKFDFWDVDRLADLIINGLIHDELRAEMISMARKELSGLRWDASAQKTLSVYEQVLN